MLNQRSRPISGELYELKEEIHQYALDYGLDFYPVNFEVCDYDTINILAAQGGFPSRYPHWRFGMDYDQLSKGYAYGLQKIYEMVINTEPVYAYLLNANHIVDQKTVMAHVYGHADFFKNNSWFRNTDRNMMDVMANHGTKIRRYMDRFGQDKVEDFIDKVLSLENLLDIDVLFETPDLARKRIEQQIKAIEEESGDENSGVSSALKSFMRSKLFNPQNPSTSKVDEDEIVHQYKKKFIGKRDVMRWVLEYAPLKEWEADILGILREEAYYFLPQRMTKIMNEG